MPSLFDNDAIAREALEAIRWPDGPQCAHCNAVGADVLRIGGQRHSHREGLYHCRQCRKQFTVTVGTVLARARIPLSTWIRVAHAFSAEPPPQRRRTADKLATLTDLEVNIGISFKTVQRVRDLIKQVAKGYKGYKTGFGAWPRSFMKSRAPGLIGDQRKRDALLASGKHPSLHSIKAVGTLLPFAPTKGTTEAALRRTECLLRLLLVSSKAA